ncbi:MAG TPA: threonine/serine dehydratase [bacterium]|nr:threonine/serine dehydratase [bacterium]
MPTDVTTLDEIRGAGRVIAGRLHRTPLVRSTALGRQTDTRLFLKAEVLQKTGSFKPRGVLNKLSALTADEKRRGLITISAGNHGQAVAYAAAEEGLTCVVVMPAYASPAKVAACRGYGAEVIVDGDVHQAFAKVRELQTARGLTLVHPYDDRDVIAGQGTIGLEILEDLPDVAAVVVPIGGGGLISGIAAAIKLSRPATRVIGVEPQGAPTLRLALDRGAPVRLDSVDTIADGLTGPIAGALTLQAVQRFVDDVLLVSDEDIAGAVRLILERTKLLAEPAGAAATAALLSGRLSLPSGTTVVAVLSGGNVDRARLKALL